MQTIANLVRSVKKSSLLLRTSAAAFAAGGVIAINLLSAAPAAACHCQTLDVNQINRNTFSFKGDLDTLAGGRITKAVYNFGDGTSTTATDNNPVTHEYKDAGNFTASVTIFLEIDGETRELTGPACNKPIEVKPLPPVYACSTLGSEQIKIDTFYFTAVAQAENGAELKSVDFDFGDGNKAQNIQPTNPTLAIASHQYAKAGDYTTTATLHFAVGDAIHDVTCSKHIGFKVDVCEFNPALPQISPDCKKPEQTQPPATPQTPQAPEQPKAPQPQAPVELPATGATDLISGGIGLSGIVAAGTHYIRARRNFKNFR